MEQGQAKIVYILWNMVYIRREATKYEERLNWMALINISHRSFLGHLDSNLKMSETAKRLGVLYKEVRLQETLEL